MAAKQVDRNQPNKIWRIISHNLFTVDSLFNCAIVQLITYCISICYNWSLNKSRKINQIKSRETAPVKALLLPGCFDGSMGKAFLFQEVKALLLPGCFPQPGNFDGKSTAITKNHRTQSFFYLDKTVLDFGDYIGNLG